MSSGRLIKDCIVVKEKEEVFFNSLECHGSIYHAAKSANMSLIEVRERIGNEEFNKRVNTALEIAFVGLEEQVKDKLV